MLRRCFVAIAIAVGFAGLTAGASVASPRHHHRLHHPRYSGLRIGGAVSVPTTYSLTQLRGMTPTSFSVTRRDWRGLHTTSYAGVPVEDLVNAAQPTLPDAKNALLRVTVTLSNRFELPVTLALGELDAGFGNHPAYLALVRNGHPQAAPELIVPGDAGGARTVPFVTSIDVGVQSPTATTPPFAGALTVQDGAASRVLSAATLAALPSQTLQVSFQAGTTPQQHTEIGPSLATVLRAARVHVDANTWVAAVGSDGYVALVTPAEAAVGGRPLQLSLNEDGVALEQPRLVVDGDVKGGRYVSGTVDLVVGHGPIPWPPRRHW